MLTFKRFCHGFLLTITTMLLSFWITHSAFDKNPYYLAQLLPFFLSLYVLLAWFIYLRKSENLLILYKKSSSHVFGDSGNGFVKDLPTQKISGEEIFEITTQEQSDMFWQDTLYTLIWSALQLAVIASILYRFYGIGASFFIP